jgi:hypothetical protein
MKKFLPFVFPVAALLIVVWLAFSWWKGQTPDKTGDIATFGEGEEIEELTDAERSAVMKGSGDYKSVKLEGSDNALGQVRYEIADGKIKFSVSADLPELQAGFYQVWLKATDSEAVRKAFRLEDNKGGYTNSAAITQEALPFDVVVTRELVDDDKPEDVVLQGRVQE